MNREFEERKRKLLEYLKEEYKEDPPKSWWQQKKPVYKTTWDFSNTQEDYQRDDYKVIIRNDKKGAASLVAFLFLMLICTWQPWKNEWPDLSAVFFMIVVLVFAILPFIDRRPKVIMDENGLWTHKWNVPIPWNLIVATYIKIDDNGEDTTYEIIIHFYDEWEDLFCEASFKTFRLDVSNEAIAYYIEYWKRTSQKMHQ